MYASEVGFDGTPDAFLAYYYIDTVIPPNSAVDFDRSSADQMTSMSFTFYSQRTEGILLVVRNEV